MARDRIRVSDNEESILDKMAGGNVAARLIAQQCYKSGGSYGPTELLALDDIGIRGSDLVLAAFGYAYKCLKDQKGRGFETDPAKRIRALWNAMQEAAKKPKPFRGPVPGETFQWPQDAFDDKELRDWMATLTCNINLTLGKRQDIASTVNNTELVDELRSILPDLPQRSSHEISAGGGLSPEPGEKQRWR